MPSQNGDRQMNDCEETDLQGSCLVFGKRKPKKNSRKEHWDEVTLKNDASRKKKKRKSSTCKDTLGRKKEKKKDKKKRKISIDSDSDVIIAQVSHAQADPTMIYKTPNLCRHGDQEAKPKRKKKVAFDLSPGYIRVKRPQFASSSQPKKGAAFHNTTMEDLAGLTQDNNSPCTSEDINSQDLFITQKTFRAPSPEPRGGEFTPTTSARVPMQRSVKNEKCEPEDSATHLYGQQHPCKSQIAERFAEEKKRIKKTRCNYLNGGSCTQVKVELQAGLSEYECVDAQPQVNRSPAEATVLNMSESWTPSQQISASTQTENFFTSEFSSYLTFVRRASARSPDLKPLDLSLPQKARRDPRMSPTKSLLPGQNESNGCQNPELESHYPLKRKAVQKDPSDGCTAEESPSLCSDSGQKSADTTASSGEEQPSRTKLDLTQVRAVQTRLNESFFFKTKGDGQSPRPESPLMKLIQGRDRKNRK